MRGDWSFLKQLLDVQIVQQEVVKKGCPPKTQMYNVLIDNLGKAGKVEEALKAFDRMREQGFSPDTVTFNIVISILGGIGKVLENQVSPNDITLKLLLQAHEETVEGYGELVDMCREKLPLDCPPSST